MTEGLLEALHARLVPRREESPERSYTARLLAKGAQGCAKKLGEEGVETALAGAAGSREELIAESADLLYHLAVLWLARGIEPREIEAELARREARSGLEEKASRGP